MRSKPLSILITTINHKNKEKKNQYAHLIYQYATN